MWAAISGIIVAVAISLLTWGIKERFASQIARYQNRKRQQRALARVEGVPEYQVGRYVAKFIPPGVSESIFEGQIVEQSQGRVLIRNEDDREELVMTIAEFEAAHVVTLMVIPPK